MSPQKKRGSQSFIPQDRYFQEAKRQGFRSRAALKLKEMAGKYQLFSAGQTVIDLGAAPGSWSQVALKAIGPGGQVLAVDCQEITPLPAPNFSCLRGDIREPQCLTSIKQVLTEADVVLSDMAPATTGIKFQDHLRSAELVRQALAVARELLRPKGHLLVKIFPGEELAAIKKEMKAHFRQVQEFVPEASRHQSREIYLIAKSYKG